MGLKHLLFEKNKTGSASCLAEHYAKVSHFSDILSGGGDWRYTRKGGINGGTRRVSSLGAAKAVCAELARLCFTEGTKPLCSDKNTTDFINKTLSENRFYERFPSFLQRVFALGGGMIKLYWQDGVRIDLVDADSFIPTKWDGAKITGAAFATELNDNGNISLLCEKQELCGDRLLIENRLYNSSGRELALSEKLPQLQAKTELNGISQPFFIYLGTGLAGADRECRVLGASVLDGAEDTLKSLDIVFDSLSREFILGKKRIIVPYYAIRGEYDRNGELKRYFDVNDEVFQAMSGSDYDEELRISDNTATLRVTEHTDAISALLDLLCMQTGLSEGALSYKNGTIKTATEVVSRNSRTYRTTAFFRGMITQSLEQLFKSICTLGKLSGELPEDASDEVQLMYADGASEDDDTRINRAVMLFKEGLISKETALSQIYGVDGKALCEADLASGTAFQ